MAPNPYTAALWLIAAACIAFAAIVWHQKSVPGRRFMALLSLSGALWAAAYGSELATQEPQYLQWWTRIQYIGIVAVPTLWLMLAIRYARPAYMTRRRFLLFLLVIPAIILIAVWTNDWHHLYYNSVSSVRRAGMVLQLLMPGPLYFVWTIAAWGYMLMGMTIILRQARSLRGLLAANAYLLLFAGLLPFVVALARAFGWQPYGVMDPTPFGLGPAVILLALLVARRGAVTLRPIARDVVLGSLDHGILVVNDAGTVADANESMARILGHREVPVGVQVRELPVPENVGAALYAGESRREEAQIGSHLYEVTISPIRNESGDLLGSAAVFVDVSEQRAAENAARHREGMLLAQAEATQALLTSDFMTGMDTALTRIGKAVAVDRVYVFENHEGDSGEVLLSQIFEWVDGSATPQIENPELQNLPYSRGYSRWYELLSQGKPVVGLIKEFPPEEQPLLLEQDIVSLLVVPIFVEDRFWGFMGFDECKEERNWSQTEIAVLTSTAAILGAAIVRQRAADRLAASEQLLHQRVDEQTRALSNAYSEIVEFADSISIHLQNDLRISIAFVEEVMRRGAETLAAQDVMYLQHAYEALRAARTRLQGLQRMRIATHGDLLRMDVDMDHLAARIVQELRESHPDRKVSVRIQSGLRAYADVRLMEHLLRELLDNAWKFTKTRPQAFIEVGAEDMPTGPAFYVRDNGIGFDPRLSSQLFRIFHTLHSGDEYEGRGVGLAIVHRVVQLHHGRVWAVSEPDKGATFYFTIPPE